MSQTTPRASPGALRPHPKLLSALVGGLVATSVVTAMIYVGPALGLDPLDFAAMLGAVIVGGLAEPMIIGLLIHLVNGSIIFPTVFVFLLYRMLPGPSWLRGMAWGITLWVLLQLVLMPLAGMGLFSSKAPHPMLSVAWSLAMHGLYGIILGMIARPQLERAIHDESEEQSGRSAA
jgi:hypothetical protein